MMPEEEKSFLKKIIPITALVGGLCCFTPVVLVLLGLSSVTYAASLSDILYSQYKWHFRGVALFLLLTGIFWYFYKKEGICTLDQAKKNRTRIINLVAIAVISGVIAYLIWLYIIVEYLGIWLGIWS